MNYLGDWTTADTVPVLFNTFDSAGASVTLTGLAVTDIEIYKDGSVTQRASDAGYTLLDTDGIDFDGITGVHGFSIDLSDNTDSGFYANGSVYHVVVSAVTVDSQTVSFVAGFFTIGKLLKPATAGRTLNVAADGDIGGNVDGAVASVAGAVGSVTGNVGGNVVGSVASVTGNVGGNVVGSVSSVTGGINTGAGILTTLDGLNTAQNTQHGTTQGKVDTAQGDLDIITGASGVVVAPADDTVIQGAVQYDSSGDTLEIAAGLYQNGTVTNATACTINVFDYDGTSVIANAAWDTGPSEQGTHNTWYAQKATAGALLANGKVYYARIVFDATYTRDIFFTTAN